MKKDVADAFAIIDKENEEKAKEAFRIKEEQNLWCKQQAQNLLANLSNIDWLVRELRKALEEGKDRLVIGTIDSKYTMTRYFLDEMLRREYGVVLFSRENDSTKVVECYVFVSALRDLVTYDKQ